MPLLRRLGPSPRLPRRWQAFGAATLLAFAWMFALAPRTVLAQAALAPSLSAQLAQVPAEAQVAVYAVLEQQASGHKVRAGLRDAGLTRAQRGTAVLAHLKRENVAEQRALVSALGALAGVSNVRAHWLVNVVAFSGTPEAIATIASRADVRAVNLDVPWIAESTAATTVAAMVPDAAEAGLVAINAPAMWARGYTGFGGVALTADTGVDPFHPAIGHKFAAHDGRSTPWFASEAFPNATDCGDHGTHVNGTIMGLDRLTNDTIGVAPGAHWLGGAILCGTGTGDNLSIFEWALDPDGDASTVDDRPFVINNSWYDPSVEEVECTGGNPYPQLLDNLQDAGIAVIFSAGNSGPEPRTITPPHSYNANLTNAFTVGALDGNRAALPIAEFSSRGPATCSPLGESVTAIDIKPEVSAPGVDVRSCLPGGGYGLKSGTSMAAPHTAGAVLLLHEAFPSLDGDAVVEALYYSARDLGAAGEDNSYGRGIIDVDAAYEYLVAAGHEPVPAQRPALAVDLVATSGELRQCAGPLELSFTFVNSGTVPVTAVSYELSGLEDQPIAGSSDVDVAPGERLEVPISFETAAEGRRFVTLRVTSINGRAADPRLDLGAAWDLRRSESSPPALVTDAEEGELCLGSPVTLRLDGEPTDEAFAFFTPEPGYFLVPASAENDFTYPALTETVTLYGLNEYRRAGGPALTEDLGELAFAPADNAVLKFRALRDGVFREFSVVSEVDARITVEVVDDYTEEVVGQYNRRAEQGLNRIPFYALLQAGRPYSVYVTRDRGLGYNPSVPATSGELAGFVDILGVESEDVNLREGSFFLFDWKIGYYDGCAPTAVTLTPDTTRVASARDLVASTETPAVGVEFEVTDATVPAGRRYAWTLNGEALAGEERVVGVTAASTGEQMIRAQLVDGDGCATGGEIEVSPEAAPSSTREALAVGEFRLWPNPTADFFRIDGDAAEIEAIDILDAGGRTVAHYSGGSGQYPVGDLPAGNYIVRLIGYGGASKGFSLEVQR